MKNLTDILGLICAALCAIGILLSIHMGNIALLMTSSASSSILEVVVSTTAFVVSSLISIFMFVLTVKFSKSDNPPDMAPALAFLMRFKNCKTANWKVGLAVSMVMVVVGIFWA